MPAARGNAARIEQTADAYKEQTVAEATGQASRFTQVYEQYKKAPDITRERLYIETMERILQGSEKIILDAAQSNASGAGIVPVLPLNDLLRQQQQRPPTPSPQPSATSGASR